MRRGGYGWFTLCRSKKFAAILQKQVSSFLIRTQCSQTAFNPIRFYSLLTLQQGVKPKALFSLTSPVPAWLESVFTLSSCALVPHYFYKWLCAYQQAACTTRSGVRSSAVSNWVIWSWRQTGKEVTIQQRQFPRPSWASAVTCHSGCGKSPPGTGQPCPLWDCLTGHWVLLLNHNDQQLSYLLHLYRSLPVAEILTGCATRSYAWSRHWNDSSRWQQTVGETNADPRPIPQKASTSSSSHFC